MFVLHIIEGSFAKKTLSKRCQTEICRSEDRHSYHHLHVRGPSLESLGQYNTRSCRKSCPISSELLYLWKFWRSRDDVLQRWFWGNRERQLCTDLHLPCICSLPVNLLHFSPLSFNVRQTVSQGGSICPTYVFIHSFTSTSINLSQHANTHTLLYTICIYMYYLRKFAIRKIQTPSKNQQLLL